MRVAAKGYAEGAPAAAVDDAVAAADEVAAGGDKAAAGSKTPSGAGVSEGQPADHTAHGGARLPPTYHRFERAIGGVVLVAFVVIGGAWLADGSLRVVMAPDDHAAFIGPTCRGALRWTEAEAEIDAAAAAMVVLLAVLHLLAALVALRLVESRYASVHGLGVGLGAITVLDVCLLPLVFFGVSDLPRSPTISPDLPYSPMASSTWGERLINYARFQWLLIASDCCSCALRLASLISIADLSSSPLSFTGPPLPRAPLRPLRGLLRALLPTERLSLLLGPLRDGTRTPRARSVLPHRTHQGVALPCLLVPWPAPSRAPSTCSSPPHTSARLSPPAMIAPR